MQTRCCLSVASDTTLSHEESAARLHAKARRTPFVAAVLQRAHLLLLLLLLLLLPPRKGLF
jgi:hypothetical protein